MILTLGVVELRVDSVSVVDVRYHMQRNIIYHLQWQNTYVDLHRCVVKNRKICL